MNKKEELLEENSRSFENRKKEIENYFLFLKNQNNIIDNNIKDSLNKSFILLLYAHWEGFIKEITKNYFSFITLQKRTLKDMTDNFYWIHFKDLLKNYTVSNKIILEKELLEQILNIEKKFKINVSEEFFLKYILGTENNLKSENYKNICNIINYECDDTTGKFKRILDKLVHNRNSIAHTGNKATENTFTDILNIEDMKENIVKEMENGLIFLERNINDKNYLKTSMHN